MLFDHVKKGFEAESGETVPEQRYFQLCLNEAFVAEHDVASASRYRLVPDKQNLGLYKSSGLIISTGCGSSGWLKSARQIIPQKISDILSKIGTRHQSNSINEALAHKIS
jgi:hypothetical protein